MNRVARLSLAAGAALVGFACQDQRTPTSPLEPPAMQIQDGFNGGNSHFHFLPPIRPFNMPPPKTAPFNPNLSPVIDICEWNGTACVQQVAHLTMGTRGLLDRVFVLPEFEQYLALWRTDQLHLDPTKTYRISVLVGTRVLGFADVDVVKTLREASKVDRADFVPLLNNLILPIGFRIEQGALCDGVSCDSKTINLRQGGSVVLATTGDRVDIPAQTSDQVVTVTVKLCADPNGLLADLPHFGNCLTVTADPRLAAPLSPPATVSMCSLHDFIPGLVHAQQDLVTLHRQDIVGEGTTLTALPHSHDFCPTPIGAAPLQPARNWLVAGWRAARHGLATLFGARQLHAATAVLDVGGGGETPLFSDFQFLLPSQINFYGISDFGQRPAGAVLPAAVKVTDALGAGVANATVRFNYNPPSGAGGVVTGPATCHPGTTDNLVCTTDQSGTVQVNWGLSDATNASHLLQARSIGMGIHRDLDGNGPFDACVPVFQGDVLTCSGRVEVPVDRNRGAITFTATTAGQPDLTIESIAIGPTDLSFADEVTYDVTVRNRGTAGSPATTVFLDGPSGLSGDVGADVLNVPALSPGAASTVRSRLGPRVPGTASVVATVDPNNTISESIEENNTFTTESFDVAPKIDFETLGNGTPIETIGLPLALVNDYALQGVAFSFIRFDETQGVASLCNSRGADPTGITTNHAATINASGDPCSGFIQGEVILTFAPGAGLPKTVRFQLRGNNSIDPFPIDGVDAAGSSLVVTRSNVSTYTSNNGFTARQETVEIQSAAGIANIFMNLPAGTGAVFLDDLVIIR